MRTMFLRRLHAHRPTARCGWPHAFVRAAAFTLALTLFACESSVEPVDDGPEVASVEVSSLPGATTVTGLGATVQLSVVVKDGSGAALQGQAVTWRSSNEAVATVNGSGMVTAVGYGSATITARAGIHEASVVITVLEPVSSVTVEPASLDLLVGETRQLQASVRGPDGNVLEGRAVQWSSSAEAIATVDGDGRVTGRGAGEAVISARAGERTGTARIQVAPRPVATLSITPETVSIVVGASTQLTATLRDDLNNVLEGRPVAWSSGTPSVAQVDGTGRVSAVSEGTATITATAEGKTGSATITVTPPPVATVEISPPSATLAIGATAQLTATARGADGATLSGRVFTWSSDNEGVARVDQTGNVTAVAAGTASITAVSEGRSGAAAITVVQVPVASVVVSPATATVQIGRSVQLTAEARDANGNVLAERPLAWSTSNPTAATVDATGRVTGVSAGTANITVTSEGRSAVAAITVVPVPVASVEVSPSTATLQIGTTVQLTAVARDAAGDAISGKTFAWTAGACATVDQTGLATGAALGTCTVSASVEGRSGSATVTVVLVPVATVSVSPAAVTIKVGSSTQLAAQAFDASGNPLAGRTFTWNSSDAAIASVDAAGKVTGKTAGTVTITATSEGKSASATITVEIPPVASIVVTPASPSMTVGGTVQLTAQARDADGDPIAGKTFAWTSSNTSVATVDASGKVTGVAVGSATITASVDGKNGQAGVTVASAPTGDPIACGDVLSAVIAAAGAVNVYAFVAGGPGQTILLTMYRTAGLAGMRATLLSPSGEVLGDVLTNSQSSFTLDQPGTHVIRVSGNPLNSTGSYNLGLECLRPPAVVEQHLNPGDVVSGKIDVAADVDLYTFSGEDGQRLLFTLYRTAGNAGLVATILSPSSVVVGGLNTNSQVGFDLTETGTYTIYVRGSLIGNTDSYNLGLESLSPPAVVELHLNPGDVVSGKIDVAADVDLYTFSGEDGQRLLFTLYRTAGNAGLVATILSPSGGLVGGLNTNSQVSFDLTETGTYTIYVRGSLIGNTDSYNLGLESLRPPAVVEQHLSTGDLVSGKIDVAADVDLYTFSGQSGQKMLVTLVRTAGNAGLVATILSPSGAVVGSLNSNSQVSFDLTESGTYVIYVRGSLIGNTDSYNLGLQ